MPKASALSTIPRPPPWERPRWRDPITAALLALLVVAFYAPVVIAGRAFYLKDTQRLFYPTHLFLRQRLCDIDIPEWLPTLDMGLPFLGNPAHGALYPLNVLLLLPAPYCVGLFVVAHAVIAILGAFFLLRALLVGRLASAVGSTAFALGGYMVSLTWGPSFMMSLAWLPLVAVFVHRSLCSGRASDAAVAGLVWALQILSGEPQSVVFTGWFLVALVIGFPRRRKQKLWKRALQLAIATAMAVCIALPQILAALDLIPRSRRASGIALSEASHWSLHPLRLLELLVSNLFGNPIHFDSFLGYFMNDEGSALHRDPWMVTPYFGSSVLLFAIVALMKSRRPHRYWVRSLSVLLGIAVLLALGRHTPAFEVYYRFVPGARLFRYPAKLFGLAAAIFPLLGAAGFDAWRRCPTARRPLLTALSLLGLMLVGAGLLPWATRMLHEFRPSIHVSQVMRTLTRSLAADFAVVATTVVLFAMARWRNRPGWYALCGALAIAQVFLANWRAYETVPARVYAEPPLAKRVRATTPAGEVTRLMNGVETLNIPNLDAAPGPLQAQAYTNALMKDMGIAFGLGYADSYIGSEEGRKYDFWRAVGPYRRQMLDVFSVRHLILSSDLQLGEKSGLLVLNDTGAQGASVYENPTALPFAFPVASVGVVATEAASELALRDPRIARGLYAVVDDPLSRPSEPQQLGRVGKCRTRVPLTDRTELDCDLSQDGYVVVNESYHPQFAATVDGVETPILRANAFVMAVKAPAGRHRILLEYSEQSLVPGFMASMCGIAICFLLVYRARVRRTD